MARNFKMLRHRFKKAEPYPYIVRWRMRVATNMRNRTPRCTEAALDLYIRIHHQYVSPQRMVMEMGLENLSGS